MVLSIRESTIACALLGALACNFESSGGGTGSGDASGSTSDTDGTVTSGPSTSAPTTTGNTSASETHASTGEPSTGEQSGPSDASTTAVADGSTGSAADDASSSSGGEPEEHHVQHGTQSACDEPLWCSYNGMIDVPAGGPIEGQECFLAPVEPPFELIAMHYSVASVHTELETFELRVYGWEGDEPTRQLGSIELNSLGATPMEHDYVFEPAIQIDTAGFCVGFATTEMGLASALGMAVDTDSTIDDVSFIRMEGPCDAPTWQEVIGAGLDPTGNWCMDATIRTIP
jgi:hypothetical protein